MQFKLYSFDNIDNAEELSNNGQNPGLIEKAYQEMYSKKLDLKSELVYSKAFKGYNAKVRYTKTNMEFRLSYSWKNVSDEIKIGLLQSLFNKMYKTNISTINIELYEIFVKKIPAYSKKIKTDPVLEESFNRINEEYFHGLLEKPNLEFGGKNFNTLGTYNHGTDTIRISQLLKKDMTLLDYVMYHEMLHKKLKFKKSGKKNIHHSREFKEMEKKFKIPNMEDKLKNFLKKEKMLNKWLI